ncbi:KH domain [Trypanosoma vivax]|nr:KH domain [Trypanosoma vivax]
MLPQKIEFQVSQEHIKSILGVRGSTLLELQGDTGCRISFVDGSKVRISGDLDENVQSAVMRIRQIIRECDRKQQTQNATEWGARGSEHEKLRTSDRMPSTDLLEGSCHVHQLPALADTQRSVYMEEVRYSSHQMPGSQRGEVMEESFYPQQFRALPDTQHSECREHSHCSLNPQVPENTIRSDYLYGSYNLQYVQALNDTQRSVLLEESHCLPHQAIGSSNIKMDDSYNAPSLQVPVSTARTEPLEDSYFPQQFRTFTDIQRFRRLDDSHCASSLDAQANTIKSERLDESCYPRHLQALIGMQQAKSSLLPHSAGTQKGEHMDESSCSPQQLSDSQKEEALDESCYPRHLPALADTQRQSGAGGGGGGGWMRAATRDTCLRLPTHSAQSPRVKTVACRKRGLARVWWMSVWMRAATRDTCLRLPTHSAQSPRVKTVACRKRGLARVWWMSVWMRAATRDTCLRSLIPNTVCLWGIVSTLHRSPRHLGTRKAKCLWNCAPRRNKRTRQRTVPVHLSIAMRKSLNSVATRMDPGVVMKMQSWELRQTSRE